MRTLKKHQPEIQHVKHITKYFLIILIFIMYNLYTYICLFFVFSDILVYTVLYHAKKYFWKYLMLTKAEFIW